MSAATVTLGCDCCRDLTVDRCCHQAARDGILAHVEAAARARQEHAEAKRETAAAKDDMLQDLAQAAQERQAQAEAAARRKAEARRRKREEAQRRRAGASGS